MLVAPTRTSAVIWAGLMYWGCMLGETQTMQRGVSRL